MSENIEHLKTHKISNRPASASASLPVMNTPPPVEELEAYGGTGIEPTGPIDKDATSAFVVATLKCIYDPEIPLNIYDLGLIYNIEVGDDAVVHITMTLTAPGCPVADMIVREVAERVGQVPGVKHSHVKLSWDPAWTQERMTDEAKLELGLL